MDERSVGHVAVLWWGAGRGLGTRSGGMVLCLCEM